ncbi:MAG TPA: hypothetical protein PLT32_01035 [bacterium]|nr:hypothetical protein [bacterium]
MDEELRRILAKQAEAIDEIKEKTQSIYRYIRWQKFWNWFRLLIILVPLIAGAIYLPPMIKDLIDNFSSLRS